MNSENNKLCPFCESEMMIIQDNLNNGKPYPVSYTHLTLPTT